MQHCKSTRLQFKKICKLKIKTGTSLEIQWLRLRTPNAQGMDLISGQGIINRSHIATQYGPKIFLKKSKLKSKNKTKNNLAFDSRGSGHLSLSQIL